MSERYIVATDRDFFFTGMQPAKLYKLTGCRNRAVLAGTGTVDQMQALADKLNGEVDE
jgi:hypothetical protein